MPSQLICRPEQELPVAVLRVAGSLDIVTAATLRRAVHGCLADQPDAVVVDVAEVEVGEPLALAVFAAVTREAADWPAVPVVLCAAGGGIADRLASSPVRRSVLVAASCAEAFAQTARRAAPAPVRATLPPVADACRQARELVADACERWQLARLGPSACVLVSELVANVVRHARTPMQLTVGLRGGRLSVAVRDGSCAPPVPGRPDPANPGGRGLLLVRELAERWGTRPVADGKVVWATMPG